MDVFTTFIADHWPLIAGAAISIILAGLFAGAETAMLFANKVRLHQLAEKGNARARVALDLTAERDRLHNTLLLVENFFLVLSMALNSVVALHLFGNAWVAITAVAVPGSILVVLLAKLAPKGLVSRNPDGFALAAAFPLKLLIRVLAPLGRVVTSTAARFTGPESSRNLSCTAIVTEEDIKALINLGGKEGALEEEEQELLHKVFEFGDIVASEAMRPRTEIVSINADARVHDALSLVAEHGYSRYPVIEGTVDSIVGILYVKDILISMSTGEVKRDDAIRQFIRTAAFIPENKRGSDLLSEMQRQKFQIAIVIDEYGGTSGLVTLEDLIEQIVGSIHDELETVEREVEIVDEKNVVVSGQSGIDEVNELLGTELQSRDFNTVGGLVFGLFGRMPRVGEQLKYKDVKFEILELDGRKIDKLKITKL